MKPSGMMQFTINTKTKLMTFRIKMSELLLTEWLTATKKQMFPLISQRPLKGRMEESPLINKSVEKTRPWHIKKKSQAENRLAFVVTLNTKITEI